MLLSDENQERGAMKDEEIFPGWGTPHGCAAAVLRREWRQPWDAGSRLAHLTHLAYSEPPEGRAGWTLTAG